jgi:hypothetical protein
VVYIFNCVYLNVVYTINLNGQLITK